MRADEAGRSGEEDAIAAQRVRPRGNSMVLTLLRSKKEITLKFSFIAIATIGLIFSSACSGARRRGALAPSASAAAQTLAAPSAEADPTEAAAAAYCKQTGGQVEVRRPVYGSNGPSLLFLAGERRFCQYTAQTSGASRIHILLKTLYTTKPTLAALAYIAAPPLGSCQRQPGIVLLHASGRIGSVRRHDRRGRRMVQEERHRSNARGMHLPGHVVDRFVGSRLSLGQHHSRHRSHEGHALQGPRCAPEGLTARRSDDAA